MVGGDGGFEMGGDIDSDNSKRLESFPNYIHIIYIGFV